MALLTAAALHFWIQRRQALQQMQERLAHMHTRNNRLEIEMAIEKAQQVHEPVPF